MLRRVFAAPRHSIYARAQNGQASGERIGGAS
jgi:hypothetical protein